MYLGITRSHLHHLFSIVHRNHALEEQDRCRQKNADCKEGETPERPRSEIL